MGEFSYGQSDFQSGYGFEGEAGQAPAATYGTEPGYQMAGYQQELAALIPQDIPLLAAILMEKGVLDSNSVAQALERQAVTGDSLAQTLLDGAWAAPDQLVEALQTRASYR
jgi:hypothetical protein